MFESVEQVQARLGEQNYICDKKISTVVFLAEKLEKPVLVEGPAGVGKTDLAKVVAAATGRQLIRLQCYEGLDVNTALYEWNYQKQLLRLRIAAEDGGDPDRLEELIFSRDYLLERPLLRAITAGERAPVLLIDEVDRADEGFEAFLLEVLSDFQVSIPELGTITARHRPRVVLTSNRTREIGDALRRRCLYLFVEHPSLEKEVEIIRTKVPEAGARLAEEIARFMVGIRDRRLMKPPGVAETLDWARALVELHQDRLDDGIVQETLGCILKDHHDITELAGPELRALVGAARAGTGEEGAAGA